MLGSKNVFRTSFTQCMSRVHVFATMLGAKNIFRIHCKYCISKELVFVAMLELHVSHVYL